MAAGCLQVYMVTAAMLLMEFMTAADRTINKAAMNRGMSSLIFLLYENILAAIFLLLCSIPFYRKRCLTPPTISIFCRICFLSIIRYLMHIFKSFGLRYTSPALAAAMYNLGPAFTFLLAIICRKRCAPPLTISIFLRICILGFVSGSLQLLMNFGIRYSSPTLASVMTNLVPAFTYLLATVSRMEKLNLKMRSNQAKALGTLISVAGAIIVTLYKGLPLTFFSTQSYSLHRRLQLSPSEWVLGGLLLSLGCFFKSLLYIVQTWIIRDYPEELLVTTISYTVSTIQSSIVCLVAERNSSTWRLSIGWDLFAVIYSGVLVHTLRALVHTWVCRTNGPVYTAMYQPLGLIIATILGVSFLKDTLLRKLIWSSCDSSWVLQCDVETSETARDRRGQCISLLFY